jgi:predicted LPLAT superfamily acyltransferase
VWGYRFFIKTVRLFGVSAAYGLARVVVVYYILFTPRTVSVIYRYFRTRHCFGRWKSLAMVYRNYYRFAQVLIDKIALPAGFAKGFSFRFDHSGDLPQILDSRQGCIFITAHVGNWEVAGQFFGNHRPRLNIVMLDAERRQIKNLLDALADERNYRIIPLQNDMSHVFEIGKAMVDREYVCFQGDRYLEGSPTLSKTLLGAQALFPAGPFRIAAKSHAPVVFFFAMREPQKSYRFYFHAATVDPEAARDAAGGSIAAQYVRVLEGILRRYPEQWFNYYDFWQKQ